MKILITGGAGYIGSVLTKYLHNLNHTITVYDNFIYKTQTHHEGCTYIIGDVRNSAELIKLIQAHDVIIPLAALVGMDVCDMYPDDAVDINTKQIAVICNNVSKNQKLVLFNTNSQYGSSETIVDETSKTKPLSHYARTKCDAEEIALNSSVCTVFRLATVFGLSPRMRLDLLVNNLTYQMIKYQMIELFEPHFMRNFIHVRDVCSCVRHVLDNDVKESIFNVGNSRENMSKIALAKKIKNIIPSADFTICHNTRDPDKRDYMVSNDRIESTGWVAEYSIDFGVKEIVSNIDIIDNQSCIKYNSKV